MKKFTPYIVGGAVLLLFIAVLLASRGKPVRRMDERITLRQQDKIPYGTAVARHLLPTLFPVADVATDTRYPGSWDRIDMDDSGQAVILVADYFDAEDAELRRLGRFVEKGNAVFIIARAFSDDASNFFHIAASGYNNLFYGSNEDSLQIRLEQTSFAPDSFFVYPGKRYESSLRRFDSARTIVFGRNDGGWANFIGMKKGSGTFFLHTAPLAFSNYFILHKQNVVYYQNVLSVLPKNVKTVVWNEYYLQKAHNPSDDKDVNWLGALFRQPAFRRGFLTAIATLVFFLLLGMRRKQRMIPPHEKPKNDSLDFVKTLGRLYYDKGDHHNLAEKMSAYFLEHVRSKYKIPTHTFDEDFVRMLQAKSGYPEPELNQIVGEMKRFSDSDVVSEEELAHFHKNLELFYQNT